MRKKLRLPRINTRSIASLIVAIAIGGGIGWWFHTPEPVQPPPRYAGVLPPVPPPAPPPPAAETVTPPPPPSVVPSERPPWQRFAIASPPIAGRIPIALVIDDVGVDQVHSKRAIDELPAMVTLSLLPYGAAIDRQAEAARAKGHEIIVHVSMESDTRTVNPGPNALYTDLAPDEIARRFDWALSRFTGYVGFNNHMGSRFTSYEPGMRLIIAEAHKRGLMFLDSRTAPETIGASLSAEFGVPFASRQVFLDNDMSEAAVKKQLAALETIAKRDNGAIAIGHPHPGTLDALKDWIPTLATRGFVLVPLTAMVKPPTPRAAKD